MDVLSLAKEYKAIQPTASSAHVTHPILTGKNISRFIQGKTWAHKPLIQYYTKGGFNPGKELVDFDASFHNYLSTTALWEMPFRVIGAGIGICLWYMAEAVQWFYTISYQLLNIHNIEKMEGHSGGGFTISNLFHYMNDFGLSLFFIVVVATVIGALFNSSSYRRYKNLYHNMFVITFFLFCLPWAVSTLSTGVNSVAQGMFKGETTNHPERNPNNFANQAFEDNVASVPMRLQNTKPGQDLATRHVYRFHGRAPIRNVNVTPVFIDLYAMNPAERDAWNGLNQQTVPTFLDNYMSPEEAVNNDTITKYGDFAGQQEKDGSKIAGAIHSFDSKVSSATSIADMGGAGSLIHNLAEGSANATANDYDKDFTKAMEYHVTTYGLDNSSLASYELTKFQQFGLASKIGSSVSDGSSVTTKPFMRSYGYYSVNWLGIYTQLIMIILIIGAYLFKTFELIFKNVIMYISSGALMFRNADNPQRIKAWMRDFFSIYEMAIMDIIMCYIAMQFIYPAYHQFNAWMLVKSNSSFIANRWTVMAINLIGDIALFVVSLHGLKSVDNMVGSSGGGASSGASGYFGGMLALHGSHAIAKGIRGAGLLASSPFKGARDAMGLKGSMIGPNGKLSNLARRNTKGGLLRRNRIASAERRAKKGTAHSQRTNGKRNQDNLKNKKPGDNKNRSYRNRKHRTGMNDKTTGNHPTDSTTPNDGSSTSDKSDDSKSQGSAVAGGQNTPDGSEASSGLNDNGSDGGEVGSSLADSLNGNSKPLSSTSANSNVTGHNGTARHAAEAVGAGAAGGFAFKRMARKPTQSASQNANVTKSHRDNGYRKVPNSASSPTSTQGTSNVTGGQNQPNTAVTQDTGFGSDTQDINKETNDGQPTEPTEGTAQGEQNVQQDVPGQNESHTIRHNVGGNNPTSTRVPNNGTPADSHQVSHGTVAGTGTHTVTTNGINNYQPSPTNNGHVSQQGQNHQSVQDYVPGHSRTQTVSHATDGGNYAPTDIPNTNGSTNGGQSTTNTITQGTTTGADTQNINQGTGYTSLAPNYNGGNSQPQGSRTIHETIQGQNDAQTRTHTFQSYGRGPIGGQANQQNSANRGGSVHRYIHVHNHKQIHHVNIHKHHRPRFNFMKRPHNR